MQGDQEEMIEAARYFEGTSPLSDRQPRYDRAVMLYSKAGLLDTALDLASRYIILIKLFRLSIKIVSYCIERSSMKLF